MGPICCTKIGSLKKSPVEGSNESSSGLPVPHGASSPITKCRLEGVLSKMGAATLYINVLFRFAKRICSHCKISVVYTWNVNVKCAMYNTQCATYLVSSGAFIFHNCSVRSAPLLVCSVQCSPSSVQCSPTNVHCAAFPIQYAVFPNRCAMFRIQCAVFLP